MKPKLLTWNEVVATQPHVDDDEIFQNLLHNDNITLICHPSIRIMLLYGFNYASMKNQLQRIQ